MNKKSSFFRLDEQVFFTLGAVCLLSLLVMAFRYASSTPCSPVKIAVNSRDMIAGNVIRFNAAAEKGKTFSWNFGDGTTKEEELSITNHVYKNAGRFTVTVIVNDQCTDMQDVVIVDAPIIVNTSLQPIIKGPSGDTAYVNQPVQFGDLSTGATKWEWRFGQTTSIDATDKFPVYTYTIPGRKTIRLKVNDRSDMVVSYSLVVLEKPTEKSNNPKPRETVRILPPIILHDQPHTDPLKAPGTETKPEPVKEKPKAPALTNEQLKAMLMQVAQGQKRAEDFSEYLGGKLGIQVFFNSNAIPFTQMCTELQGMKKTIKSLKVNPVTDGQTNYILSMTVVTEKKGLLKRIFN